MKNLFTRSGCNKALFFYSRFSHCRLSLLSFAIASTCLHIYCIVQCRQGGRWNHYKRYIQKQFSSSTFFFCSVHVDLRIEFTPSTSAVNKNCTRQPFAKHEFLMHLSFSSALFTLAFLLLSLCFACMHAFCASLHYTPPPPQLDDVEEKEFFSIYLILFFHFTVEWFLNLRILAI